MKPYVTALPINSYTPEAYYDYVKSLRVESSTTPFSKAADGIKLCVNGSKLIIKCTRPEKLVTTSEVRALALEYAMDLGTLTALLTARKFKIVNEEGEVTNARPKRTRASRRSRTAKEANAHLDIERGSLQGIDQFFIAGPSVDVPQESALQSEPGTEKA